MDRQTDGRTIRLLDALDGPFRPGAKNWNPINFNVINIMETELPSLVMERISFLRNSKIWPDLSMIEYTKLDHYWFSCKTKGSTALTCIWMVLTAVTRFFSFLCNVYSPSDSSNRVVVPVCEPLATRRPCSCTRILCNGSSHTYKYKPIIFMTINKNENGFKTI